MFRRNVLAILNVLLLLVTAYVVSRSPILVALIMEAILTTETSLVSRATMRNIQEDGVLHSHRRENFKFYIAFG
jgi:hypothetical protein